MKKKTNLSDYDPNFVPSAGGLSFGIAVSDWNQEITHTLLKGCLESLEQHGAKTADIQVVHVPGSYELPKAADWLANMEWVDEGNDSVRMVDAVVCLGCVITGETRHDEYINSAVAQGVMQLNLSYDIPFIFGVLTPSTMQQALDRAGGKHGNKGVEAAITAIKMAHMSNQFNEGEYEEED